MTTGGCKLWRRRRRRLWFGKFNSLERCCWEQVSKHITEATMSEFIDGLDVSPAVRAELHAISPHNFTGDIRVK